ncbi:Arc family DNA-binding protein [Ancylobacter sp. VNQ12]|uniref:Arc family DNA-binding protein n=1 Tax=Ancylobacter sp. VNQ12 TaxID=3400920 RepID=UPI003C02FFC8
MSEKTYPSQSQDRFIVRLPDGMRERIAEEARKNNRSMNAEIVTRLESSFLPMVPIPMPDLKSTDNVDEILERLSKTVRELSRYQEHYLSLLKLRRGDFDKPRVNYD